MKTTENVNPPRRAPKEIDALGNLAFAMQMAALEAAARVVVACALDAPCEGGIKLRTPKYAKSVEQIFWRDYFHFIGEQHYRKPFIRPAGFAPLVACEKWGEESPPSADELWKSVQSGERELSSVDDLLADGSTVADLAACVALVNDNWEAILKEQDCIVAEAVLRACAWPYVLETRATH